MSSFVRSIEPIVVERGYGAVVEDAAGNEYIDCFAGIAVVNVGHSHPHVTDAAKAQIERIVHAASYVYHVSSVADLAEALAEIAPGSLSKTFFCTSGAEAIEAGMRLAKIVTGRSEFIALQRGFHGRSYATLSVTGNAQRKSRGGPYMGGVAFAPTPYCYRCPLGLKPDDCGIACADAVSDVIRYSTSDDVAAFIVEPVLGEGGIIPLPEGYLERVQAILREHGILLLADEVQTGFGRTGRWFGVEHDGVEPDLMAMAKGIAAGFPLGALIAPDVMADSFRPGEHLSTFGGNPVSCAAALASIGVIRDEKLVERSATLGDWALERLEAMKERHQLIGDVRGRGLMIGLELVKDREKKEPAAAEANEVRAILRNRGILVGVGGQEGNVVRVQPPLVISEDQLGRALEQMDVALAAVSP